jgi:hypothetical protein
MFQEMTTQLTKCLPVEQHKHIFLLKRKLINICTKQENKNIVPLSSLSAVEQWYRTPRLMTILKNTLIHKGLESLLLSHIKEVLEKHPQLGGENNPR